MLTNPFSSAFTKDDWMSGDVAVVAGQWIEFGRITGQAGIGYALGFEAMSGQDSAAGRIYMLLQTGAAVAVNGDLRIEILDPQDRVQKVIWEKRTETVATGAGDRTKQVPFPMIPQVVCENYKFSFKIKADSSVTISKANSTIIHDVTTFDDK